MDGAQVLGLVAIAMLGLCNRDDQEAPRGVSMAPSRVESLQGTYVGTVDALPKCNRPLDALRASVEVEWIISQGRLTTTEPVACNGAPVRIGDSGAVILPHVCRQRMSSAGAVINEKIMDGTIEPWDGGYMLSLHTKLVASKKDTPQILECDILYGGVLRKTR